MLQEPEHYTESDHFFFEFNDELEKVCNAPKDKQGVFKIIELRKRKINLVYIGYSSQQGLFDAIVNGLHHDGKPRKDTLPQQLSTDETDALDIYWYVPEPPLSAKIAETEMIKDYCYGGENCQSGIGKACCYLENLTICTIQK